MNKLKVDGENRKHHVLLYALSTCAWCKMTKRFLSDNKIAYDYVDVDLAGQKEKDLIKKDILDRGGELSYPTVIIDGKTLITGFRKDKLTEALEL